MFIVVLALFAISFISFFFFHLKHKRKKQENWLFHLELISTELAHIIIKKEMNVFQQERLFLIFCNSSWVTIWEEQFKYPYQLKQTLKWWEKNGLNLTPIDIQNHTKK